MVTRSMSRASLLVAVALAALGTVAQAQARPPEVTDSAIARGRAFFHGHGNCSSCHGDDARGGDEGPALPGEEWKKSPQTFAWVLNMVHHGAPGARSRGGDPHPMTGPTALTPEEAQDVAAYVWSLSTPHRHHRKDREDRPPGY